MTTHRVSSIEKHTQIGHLRIKFSWRSSKSPMGRFGGGWQWNLGVQVGSTSVVLNLLIFSLRFDWVK